MPSPFAIITGASRGIGEEYAWSLGARGYDLFLIGRDHTKLNQVATDISHTHGVSVDSTVLDLSLPDAGHRLYQAARQRRDVVDLLINNAGFGMYGSFVEFPMTSIRHMLHLHINTVVESIRLFLPAMIERRSGTIINVASLAGLIPIPYFAEYSATKAFLISFSESLAVEVRPYGVTIQACCPGQTRTDFHARAGFQPHNPFGSQPVQEVVSTSLASLNSRSPLVTIGWQGRLSAWLARWIPRSLIVREVGKRMKPPDGSPERSHSL